jgi:hypothetical protein
MLLTEHRQRMKHHHRKVDIGREEREEKMASEGG